MDGHTDVISDVLETMHFTTQLFGRFELGAPWAIRVPQKETSSFYVLARGSLRLKVEGLDTPILLSAGDVVLVPHGAAHVLDDGSRRTLAPRDLIPSEQLRGSVLTPRRLGGEGPASTLVVGCFRFSAGVRSPLFTAFPPAIHLPAHEPGVAPWLAATVQLIVAESSAPGPGSAIVLGRLADVLLVQALRTRAAATGPDEAAGLRALADPQIGAALGLMHGRLAEPWTVERLAAAVGQSRSGFAARFHALVGEPPLQYLARWRMTKAAQWLRETDDSLPEIAERVGYVSAVAFNKAFKRWHGVGPGGFRRARGEVRAEEAALSTPSP
ncbi:AraC-like DNA-binding protein [Archangium gephyra]|uniref:AraC-like DNA-binding protein n=1 Tax=Archangium gephyra TaxID=48 RepID=A0AAC8Q9Q1_9BACT|nr:AraC family transcriptional regulator [Archangium gephyra]AKJ03603.1 transcriptional regulator, AraC family protein [Archangium gephyra]REG22616.1 AraC-like DNA-binding protein [Archangium gephyra]